MTTIMQPFQCDLQPQIQETHRTMHTGTTTRCRTQRRNRLNSKRSKPHPPHTRGTFHRRLKQLYTEKHKVSCSGFLPKRKPMQHSCSHYNAFCSMTWLIRTHLRTWQHQMTTIMQPFQCDLQPQIQETHRTMHTGTTTRCRTQRRNRLNSKRSKPHPPHTRGTFHRRLKQLYTEKHKVSCSGFLPKRKPMQHSCSHYNAFCSMTWLTRMHLRTWQYQMTTIMQPFQCDLQPQIQETHRTTHTGTTTRCRTQRRNRLNSKRSKPHPPHTRGTFHRRLKPLYTEKHKVSCSGFLPKRKPMQHSCSHYNAFCSVTWLTRMHLRTWQHQMTTIMPPFQCDLQPQIQETHRTTHTGTTTRCRTQRRNRLNSKRSKPHPPHTRGTFHRRLKQLYTEKYKVSCSGFLPKRKPMQHSCSHYNAFCSMTWLTRMHLRTWQHQMSAIMQPFQCDRQPQLQPLYTEKHKVSCSGFLPNSPLAFVTASLPHHFPSSPLPFIITSLLHHFPSSPLPIVTASLPYHFPHHFPSSPLPFFTTSLPHHSPSSSLPFFTTSLPHHSPSSSLPFFTTSLPHHFPSSPLPFLTTSLTTSLPHHSPSSSLPFFTTSLPHHSPSSSLPFFTTSLPHHFPSSPLPFLTTSLPHHFPSSPLPFVTTSLPHHFPSSPLPISTTSLRHHPVS